MSLPALRTALLCAACAALAGAPSVSQAADMAPQLSPSRGWQGPYVGANLTYQWGTTTNNPTDPSGFAGGLQAGYNWQVGQFVFGAEADIQASGAEDRFAPWKFSNPWFGTVRGRAGYAIAHNILFYGTGGLAYGALRAQNTMTGFSQTATGLGWAAGFGMEVALVSNWTVRAEYLYVDLNDRPFAVTGVSNGLESHLLRLGINFRF